MIGRSGLLGILLSSGAKRVASASNKTGIGMRIRFTMYRRIKNFPLCCISPHSALFALLTVFGWNEEALHNVLPHKNPSLGEFPVSPLFRD